MYELPEISRSSDEVSLPFRTLSRGVEARFESGQSLAKRLRMASTTPESAARQILGAMEKRKARLLIGWDAKIATLISRIFPTFYPVIFSRLVGRQTRELVQAD